MTEDHARMKSGRMRIALCRDTGYVFHAYRMRLFRGRLWAWLSGRTGCRRWKMILPGRRVLFIEFWRWPEQQRA